MTRGELQARMNALRVSCLYVRGRKVAGGLALKEFLRTASTAELNLAIADLRHRGIDINSVTVSPCRFPIEIPLPRAKLPAVPHVAPVTARLQPAATQRPPTPTRQGSSGSQAPSPAALAVVINAYRVALSQGLKLPASAFQVHWYERTDWSDRSEDATALGFCDPTTTPIGIHIASGMSEQQTFKTLVHEFQHAADVLRLGRDGWRAMPVDERERRAEGFSWVCVHAEYGDALQIFA